MKIELTPDEFRLLAVVLEQASDVLGSRICDDFDLAKQLPTLDERRQLMKKYHAWNGDPESFEEDEQYGSQYLYIGAGALAGYLAGRIKEQGERV